MLWIPKIKRWYNQIVLIFFFGNCKIKSSYLFIFYAEQKQWGKDNCNFFLYNPIWLNDAQYKLNTEINTETSLNVIHTEGGAVISSLFCFSTLLCIVTLSKAQPLCARVASCLIAVRKPWEIKPEIWYIFHVTKKKILLSYLHGSEKKIFK